MFFLIAFNLSDYHNRNNNIKESRCAESAELAEKQRQAQDTQPSKWDKVNNAKEILQTAPPDEEQDNTVYSIVTDENGNITGYQPVTNVLYDEDGNIISYDIAGEIISPQEYENISADMNKQETTVTKRTIPDIHRNNDEKFTIVVN
jgi:hypothetical protein